MQRLHSLLTYVNYSIFVHIKQHRKECNNNIIFFHFQQNFTESRNIICFLQKDFYYFSTRVKNIPQNSLRTCPSQKNKSLFNL